MQVGIWYEQEPEIVGDLGSYPSLVSYDVVDVADVTLYHDMIVEAKFLDPGDHFLFFMKWKYQDPCG